MTEAKSVTANFAPLCYTLTTAVAPAGRGSISANPAPNCGTQYTHGTAVELTATANTGYAFANWSGDAAGTTSPVSVTMDGAKAVTANFDPLCYTLTTAVVGSGTIDADPALNCNGTQYRHDTVVALTATANEGYTFAGWSGAATGTDNPVSVTMTGAKSVTADFTLNQYTLNVIKPGAGSGTVSSSPPGIDCGATCSAPYDYNTSVTLTATPAIGSTFLGWAGSCSGMGSCVVTMSSARSVSATFADTTVPTVTGVTSSLANGNYKAGQVVPVQVTFSESVTVSGTPQVTLSTGSPATTAVDYVSGSGTSTLIFNYTVAAGNTSADLDYAATTSLALNGGPSWYVALNNATLTLATPGDAGSLGANKDIVVDTTAPAVTVTTFPTVDNTNQAAVTLAGACEDDLAISLAVTDAGSAHTVNAFPTCSAGAWSSTLDLTTLDDGTLTATATQTDAAGNLGAGTLTATNLAHALAQVIAETTLTGTLAELTVCSRRVSRQ